MPFLIGISGLSRKFMPQLSSLKFISSTRYQDGQDDSVNSGALGKPGDPEDAEEES